MSALLKLMTATAAVVTFASPSIAQEQPKQPTVATSVHYPNLRPVTSLNIRPVTWITGMPTTQQPSNVTHTTTTITWGN